jgi:ankyrin repeat protein
MQPSTKHARRRNLRRIGWVAMLMLAPLPAQGNDLELVSAVRRLDKAAVQTLLQRKTDVDARQADGTTALHWAVYLDDLATTELLLRAGASVNAANELGVTPLYLACENGNGEMVERLLKAGAAANAALPSGETALMTAARSGSVSVVKALLARGADVQAAEETESQTALMWAVSQKHADVVKVLVDAGANIRARSAVRRENSSLGWIEEGGYTPFLFAARQGDLASARVLLAAGADVNDTAPLGTSALVVASHSGHGEFAAFLLEEGAEANADGAGYTALHTAILRGDVALVKALLAHGGDPNKRLIKGSKSGRQAKMWVVPDGLAGTTPFFLAAKFAEADIMRLLAAAGGDALSGHKDGTTPLMVAAGLQTGGQGRGGKDRRGRELDTAEGELVRSLPADTRPILNSGIEAVKLAVALGADVNAVNAAGDTALHGAALHGFETVIQFLADRGAKLDGKNKQGKTPSMVGLESEDGDGKVSATLLRKLGARE